MKCAFGIQVATHSVVRAQIGVYHPRRLARRRDIHICQRIIDGDEERILFMCRTRRIGSVKEFCYECEEQ